MPERLTPQIAAAIFGSDRTHDWANDATATLKALRKGPVVLSAAGTLPPRVKYSSEEEAKRGCKHYAVVCTSGKDAKLRQNGERLPAPLLFAAPCGERCECEERCEDAPGFLFLPYARLASHTVYPEPKPFITVKNDARSGVMSRTASPNVSDCRNPFTEKMLSEYSGGVFRVIQFPESP